jgi:hypothetical protein
MLQIELGFWTSTCEQFTIVIEFGDIVATKEPFTKISLHQYAKAKVTTAATVKDPLQKCFGGGISMENFFSKSCCLFRQVLHT